MEKNKQGKIRMQHNNKLKIRNSTADFLVFTKDAHADGIEVRVQDGDVWLTQKAIGQLFEVDRSVVTKHLKAVYASGELVEEATCANFAQVADNAKPTATNSIPWPPSLRWGTAPTRRGPRSSASGPPACWQPLPGRGMSWTKTGSSL